MLFVDYSHSVEKISGSGTLPLRAQPQGPTRGTTTINLCIISNSHAVTGFQLGTHFLSPMGGHHQHGKLGIFSLLLKDEVPTHLSIFPHWATCQQRSINPNSNHQMNPQVQSNKLWASLCQSQGRAKRTRALPRPVYFTRTADGTHPTIGAVGRSAVLMI